MDGRRLAHATRWALPIALGLTWLVTTGCDGLDSSIASPSSTIASEKAESVPAAASSRDPDMQSIGPDAAQRIYYQFIDDTGHVQFVERLSDVPTAWREQVGYAEMNQPPPLTPQEARKTWRVSSDRATEIMLAATNRTPSDPNLADQNGDVVLYSATWCGYCTQARAHLDDAGIQYELRDVDNEAVGRELRDKTGRGGVPVLDFSGEILRGYSSDQYDRAIRTIRAI
jgi:glutaredoxin